MFLSYIFAVLVVLATLLQLAVDRAPDIHDSHDNKAARRVLIAGLGCMSLWTIHACFVGREVNPLAYFGMLLIVLAEIAFCINRLFPDMGAAIERTVSRARQRGGAQ